MSLSFPNSRPITAVSKVNFALIIIVLELQSDIIMMYIGKKLLDILVRAVMAVAE